jgi:lysophospholipase L1-like esterase
VHHFNSAGYGSILDLAKVILLGRSILHRRVEGSILPRVHSSSRHVIVLRMRRCLVICLLLLSGCGDVHVLPGSWLAFSKVAPPTITPPSGTAFDSMMTISITEATSGATIYYTTDGSTPTTTSTAYGGPFVVANSSVIKAVAVSSNISSAITSAAYTEKDCNLLSPDEGNNVYAFDGDSLTAGWSGFNPIQPWTDDVVVLSGFTKYNVAHGGWQISDMYNAAPTELDPLLDSKGIWNIVWVMGGTNDEDHVDFQTVIDRLLTFARERHRAGWKVIVVTLPSRKAGDAFKNRFNDYLRTNWPLFADQIVDLGAIPQIGADGAYRNRTYFLRDGFHLTTAGYGYFSSGASDALNRLLATPFCAP